MISASNRVENIVEKGENAMFSTASSPRVVKSWDCELKSCKLGLCGKKGCRIKTPEIALDHYQGSK